MRKEVFAILVAAVIIIAFFIAFYGNKSVIKLPSAEIREYQGEKLSSINDFRENSIKGPQYINISDYLPQKLHCWPLLEKVNWRSSETPELL